MMKNIFVLIISILFFANPIFAKDSIAYEHRTLQMRTFANVSVSDITNRVIKVLYDSDFVIEEFEPEFGFIRAQKSYKQHYINKGRVAFNSLYFGAMAAYTVFSYGSTAASMYDPGVKIKNELRDKTVVVDVNVNIEQFGKNGVRVRFIPVKKILQNADGYSFMKPATIKVIRLNDKMIYDEFFKQLESGEKCNI